METHCEYTKLLRISLPYILLLLLLANSVPATRAQEGNLDARGFINTLKDGDFHLVLNRYKKRIILILCTPIFLCCACCVLFCVLPCICVVVLGCAGCAGGIDAFRTKRGPTEPPTNNIVIIEKIPGRESQVPEGLTGQKQFLYSPNTYFSNQAQYAEHRPGLGSYPKLTVTHGTIANNENVLTEGHTSERRNSLPGEDKGKDNARYNFLSLDDLNQIETRAKTLDRVKFGQSNV